MGIHPVIPKNRNWLLLYKHVLYEYIYVWTTSASKLASLHTAVAKHLLVLCSLATALLTNNCTLYPVHHANMSCPIWLL